MPTQDETQTGGAKMANPIESKFLKKGPDEKGPDENTVMKVEPSKWIKWEAYFFNHGANIAFLAMMAAFNVVMCVYGVWEYTLPHWATDNDILRITLPIARGAGRLVTWNCAVLLVTASKGFWTLVRQTPIQLGFPIDNIMPYYHRIVALVIIFMGCVIHTIPQIINYATEALVIEGGGTWAPEYGVATKQLLVTGIILFFTFLAFFVTTLSRVRNTALGFRLFWWTHVIGIVVAFPVLLVHGTTGGRPVLLYFTAVPLWLYISDSILRRYIFATVDANVVHLSTYEDGGERVVKIVIQNVNFHHTAGQYAELKIPELSKFEWHPFTIASAPNKEGKVTFYIKAVGKWTTGLYELASKSSDERAVISHVGLRGPYGAPGQNYLKYRHVICIGSGIGVTPLLSIWKYVVSASSQFTDPEAIPNNVVKTLKPDLIRWDSDETRLLDGTNINHVDVVSLDRRLTTFRGHAAYYASVLETMTVNICIFVYSLLMETLVYSVWIFHYTESSMMQVVLCGTTLFIFTLKMIISTVAYGKRYTFSTVCSLEAGIVLMDSIALGTSIANYNSQSSEERTSYFIFFSAFIVFHGVRIFYIFYATARPPRLDEDSDSAKEQGVEKISSITGIWVSRNYSSMSFAAPDLVDTVDGLSPAFSLQLYATRDKDADVERVNPFVDCGPNHALHAGRPDWEAIMTRAIERAHDCNPEGESVGIFFCGSPAIVWTLQRVAQQVTANHQYATKINTNSVCRCRLLVHKENF